jgi:O-antigen ligase
MDMNTTTDTSPQLSEQSTREKIFKILNLSVPILMGIFIFFNPFSHTTSIKEICFYGSVIIVLILICFKKIDFSFKSPLTLPFVLFVIWAFIGLFFALYKENSIHDFRAHLLKYLAIYYILINFFNSRKRLVVLSWIIIVSATIFSVGGLTYFYVILGNTMQATRITFQETSINIIGFITLFAIALALHNFHRENKLYRKVILIISLVGTIIVTLLTQSWGTFLGLISLLIVLFPKNKKSVISLSLLVITLLIAINFKVIPAVSRLNYCVLQHKLQNEARVHIWHTYFEMIKEHPIFGIGFGMEMWHDMDLWNKYTAKVSPRWRTAHAHVACNILVSTATRTGLIGLILFSYIILVFAKTCWSVIKYGKNDFIKSWGLCMTAAFVAFLVKGMFSPAVSHAPAVVFYTILAMVTILWKLDSEPDSPTLQNQNNIYI